MSVLIKRTFISASFAISLCSAYRVVHSTNEGRAGTAVQLEIESDLRRLDGGDSLPQKAVNIDGNVSASDEASSSPYPSGWPFLRHCLEPHSSGGLLNFTLPACRTGQSPDFDPSAKIAVIGAGPAGISISKLLDDRGFLNVKLIELSERVGGKSKRFEVNGEAHELGTCYITGKYECIKTWARDVGLTEISIDVPRLVESAKTVLMPMAAPNFGTTEVYMADYAFQHHKIDPTKFGEAVKIALTRYPSLWAATMGDPTYMFPSYERLNISALHQTFEEWLMERNLEALIAPLLFTMAGQGYGSPADMPALYGLMWVHPNLLIGGKLNGGNHSMYVEGFQALWERLVASTSVDLHLNTDVKSIQRKDGGVWITYSSGTEEFFDWLVMAAPMPKALALFADAADEEKELFGSLNYHELVANMFNLTNQSGIRSDFELLSWADRMHQTDYYRSTLRDGSVVREMYDADGDDGPVTLRHTANIKGFENDVVGVLQVSDFRNSDANLTTLIQEDATKAGLGLEFLYRERWDYMPFYSLNEVVEDRKPWRIWEMQGKRSTWWVGSHVSFESVADVLDYCMKLVNSRLCDIGGMSSL